ncbi:GDSL-type esterase/lipase family protein [Asanoa siamensis]|uniref:GDSL-type esterase/lipase family protein n=1 Tax=Asanoa siamensis TaxID=926357 RepID=UPI001942C411|nr:GDSL-type esterase/lipase family protein [Asanoa siamensis]
MIDPHGLLQFGEPRGFADQTLSQPLHMAGGGDAFRVRLTNLYGRSPLTIGAATASTGGGQRAVTFGGAGRVVVAPGEEIVSDQVDLAVAGGSDLVVNLYFPDKTDLATYSHRPAEIARIAGGDRTHSHRLAGAELVEGRYVVSGVDVPAPDTMVAAAFGDSWFEGVGTTPGANRRSVDFINRRLAQGWVVNLGIAGNRLLRDEVGPHALARFDRDVLPIPALTHVLVNLGINDLVLPSELGEALPTAGDLIAGYTALAGQARQAGLRIVVATIGPFAGAGPDARTPEVIGTRREVNEWIRTAGVFDGVFDVARAVADPARPDYIRHAYDSGDGIHLNDIGAEVMAEALDLRHLTR